MYEYTEEILKMSKLIGMNPIKGVDKNTGNIYYYYNDPIMRDYLALPIFDTWDELMPVVIKIESLGGDNREFDIFGNCVEFDNKEFIGETKIEAVRNAIMYYVNTYVD